MTRKNSFASLAAAVVLSLSMSACKDTKTLQENDQLKTQVANLQKENGQLGNNLETMTTARDELEKENETLRAELRPKKTKPAAKKTQSKKHRRK